MKYEKTKAKKVIKEKVRRGTKLKVKEQENTGIKNDGINSK